MGLNLRMFAYCGGRERSLNKLTDLAREAGLAFDTVTSAPPRSIVEFLPDQCRKPVDVRSAGWPERCARLAA
jgi:hypothetical protein